MSLLYDIVGIACGILGVISNNDDLFIVALIIFVYAKLHKIEEDVQRSRRIE